LTVYDRLKRYKCQKTRYELLKLELDGIKDNIRNGHGIQETKDEMIEGMTFRRSIDSMPPPSGNSESKTEKIALNLDKERDRLKPNTNKLFEEKRSLEQRIAPIEREIKETEIILSVLGKEERFVIESWFFDGLRIPMIQEGYYQKFKSFPAYNTIRRMKDRAISRMEEVIS
jgi:hypothetical protein